MYRGSQDFVPMGGIPGIGIGRIDGAGIGGMLGGLGGTMSSGELQSGT